MLLISYTSTVSQAIPEDQLSTGISYWLIVKNYEKFNETFQIRLS